ncbi:hypothetical protein ACMA1D_01475 [Streptomyces sp. 796.1]|uniref:hypothetical protein n=1 Tax=Streptomyces sp. 796.1 TaxID=3163029 RepID=UPI0039C8D021
MAAPAYGHAGRSPQPRSVGEQRDVLEVRLPWWAIALPAVVFAALLLMLVGPADAHAADSGSSHVAQFAAMLRDSIVHLLS